jgi:hypothetical protein
MQVLRGVFLNGQLGSNIDSKKTRGKKAAAIKEKKIKATLKPGADKKMLDSRDHLSVKMSFTRLYSF